MIIQTIIYICEVCNKTEFESDEVCLYSDPLISNGWDYIRDNEDDNILVCTDCLEGYKSLGFKKMSLSELREEIGKR